MKFVTVNVGVRHNEAGDPLVTFGDDHVAGTVEQMESWIAQWRRNKSPEEDNSAAGRSLSDVTSS